MKAMIDELRWQLFKVLSWIGWKVCPEPHRTRLQKGMPTWKEYEQYGARNAE